jgi:hypothetical protein
MRDACLMDLRKPKKAAADRNTVGFVEAAPADEDVLLIHLGLRARPKA